MPDKDQTSRFRSRPATWAAQRLRFTAKSGKGKEPWSAGCREGTDTNTDNRVTLSAASDVDSPTIHAQRSSIRFVGAG
jgi:hypothetical protein